ncbi:hypothetical protein RB598_009061 [Gaeumannomyces tritici]
MTSRLGPNPAPNPQRTPARPRPSTHTTAAAAAAAAPSRPITPTAGNATRVSGNGGDVPSLADTTLLNLDGSHARAGSSSDSDQTQTTPSHTETPPPPMNHILGIGSPQPSPLRLHFSAPLRSPGLFGGGGATSRFSDSFGSSNSPEGANGKTDDDDGDSDAPDDDVDDYDPTVVQESLDGHGSDDSDDDDDSDGDSHVSPAALRRKLVRVLEDQLVEVLAYLKTSAGARLETADFVVVQDQIDNVMDVFRRRGCPRLLVGPRPPRGAAAAPSRTVSIFKNMPLTPPRPRTPVHEALLDDGGDGSEAAAAAAAAAVGLVRRRRAERAAEKEADGQGGRARKQQSAGVVGRGSWSSSSCTTAASAGKQRPLSVGGGGGGAGLAASPMPPQAASTPTDVADLVVAEAEKLCLELAAVAKSLSDRRQESDHILDLLVEGRKRADDRILELLQRVQELEDEVRENESELFHIRLQLKAVELLSANSDGGGGGGGDVGHRGHHDPELVESIENFREDFEAVQERWRERRSCRGDGSTTTATGGGGGGGSSSSSFWSPLRQQQQQQGRRRRDTASYFTTPTRAGTSTGSEYLPSR